MTIRPTGPIFGLMKRRTTDHSDQWTTFRTNDPSDYRTVGLLTIRTNARFSDQWPVGPTTIRNIEPSPLVELRPGASAGIISVCYWIFHITSRFSQKDDRLQILHFQCDDCWWTGVTCGLIQLVKKISCTIFYLFLWMYFASLYSSLTFETIYVLWRLFYITEEYNLVQSKHENIVKLVMRIFNQVASNKQ